MKKNNKGFTLVELLAVIVILAIIMAFAMPNIYKVINKNKENNYEQLKETIVSATKTYISDYRYDISLNEDKITNINGLEITDSKILVSSLVDEGNIKTTKEGIIVNPRNKNECLNLLESYIKVTYNETKKDYIYGYSENDTEVNSDFYLKWVEKETDDKKINSQCYYTEKNNN